MLHFYLKIKNHSSYGINKKGSVVNFKTGKELKHSMSSSGYLTVYVDGKNELLHRLLAETFVPNPKGLPVVNHKDGNKLNNSLDNLEWCTYSYNNSHAYKTGLKKYSFTGGEDSANHKLSSEDVAYIRSHYKKYDKELGGRALAKKFNVTETCISSIVNGISWKEGV